MFPPTLRPLQWPIQDAIIKPVTQYHAGRGEHDLCDRIDTAERESGLGCPVLAASLYSVHESASLSYSVEGTKHLVVPAITYPAGHRCREISPAEHVEKAADITP
jgi:hypothetical protein